MSPRRWAQFALPTCIAAAAALLRFHNLSWNSLDNDEAFSWHLAHKPLAALISDAFYLRGDPHPPVYWVSLKAWLALVGESELALRWLSAAAGIVGVALIFELGRRLFSWRAGVISATWVALSPYLIWSNQDARMYTLGSTLLLAGVVCLVNGLVRGGRRWWPGYFVFASLACYTHIGLSFTLPFQGAGVIGALFAGHAANAPAFRRRGWAALITWAAVGLAFLPFATNAWRASDGGAPINRFAPTMPQLLREATLMLASFRAPLLPAWQWFVALFVGGVFAFGVWAGREGPRIPRPFGRLLCGLYYLSPLAVIVILSIRQPLYMPKLLVFVAGGLALGIGAGLSRLWEWQRWAGAVVGAGVLVIQLYGIGSIWQLGSQKEDWRNAARYVAEHAGPKDIVIVHLSHYRIPFNYYFREAIPVITPFGNDPGDADTVDQIMNQFTGYEAVWLVQSAEYLTDPERRVQNWLAARYPLATELFPINISVRQYVIRSQLLDLPPEAKAAPVNFGDIFELVGYDLDAERLSAVEQWMHPPTNWIHLRLYGRRMRPLTEEPALVLKVEDESGRVWGGNMDRVGEALDFLPLASWPEGTTVRLDFDLNLNAEMPPGRYKIVLRLSMADGSLLPVSTPGAGPNYAILQRIEITP